MFNRPVPSSVEHYAILPRQLFAGEYPGHPDEPQAIARLSELVTQGVRTFIDLTPQTDPLEPYEPLLGDISTELRYFRHPIPDMSVPSSPTVMRGILDRIRTEMDNERPVYFHCWGGIGRTGTVAGCWLREQGLAADEALAKVQSLYSTMPKSKRPFTLTSPQTPVQFDYVRNWLGVPSA